MANNVDHKKFRLSPNIVRSGSKAAYEIFEHSIKKRHRDLKDFNLKSGLNSYTRREELENGGFVTYSYNYGNEKIFVDMPEEPVNYEDDSSIVPLYDEYITVVKESFYLGFGQWKVGYSGYKFDIDKFEIATKKEKKLDENGEPILSGDEFVYIDVPVEAKVISNFYDLLVFDEKGFYAFALGRYNFQLDNNYLPPLFEKKDSTNRYNFCSFDTVISSIGGYKNYYFPNIHAPDSITNGYINGFAAKYLKDEYGTNKELYVFAYVDHKQTYFRCFTSPGGRSVYVYKAASTEIPVTARTWTLPINRDELRVSWDVFIDSNYDAWFLHLFDMGNISNGELPIIRSCITKNGDYQYRELSIPYEGIGVNADVNDGSVSEGDSQSKDFGKNLKIGQSLVYGESLENSVSCSNDIGAMANSRFSSYDLDDDSVDLVKGESMSPAWITDGYYGDGIYYSFMPKYSLKRLEHGDPEIIHGPAGYFAVYPTTGMKRAVGVGSASSNKVIKYNADNMEIEENFQKHYDRDFDLQHEIYGGLNSTSKSVYWPGNKIILFSWSHGYWFHIANGIVPTENLKDGADYPFEKKKSKTTYRRKFKSSYIYADSIRHYIEQDKEEIEEKEDIGSGRTGASDGVSSHWENRYTIVGKEHASEQVNLGKEFREKATFPIYTYPADKDTEHIIEWRVDENSEVKTKSPKDIKNSFHTLEDFGQILTTSYLEDDMYAIGFCCGYKFNDENRRSLIGELRIQQKGRVVLSEPDDEGVQYETIMPYDSEGKRYKDIVVDNEKNHAETFEASVKKWLGHGFYYEGVNFKYDHDTGEKEVTLGKIKREVMGIFKTKKYTGQTI